MSKVEIKESQKKWLMHFFMGRDFSLHLLTPDASKRRYYRVISDQGNSYVLCVEEPFIAWQHPFLVYRHLWCQNQLPVPQVMAFCGELGLILLQDLGDLSLQRFWALSGAPLWGNNTRIIFNPAPVIKSAERKALTCKIIEDINRIQALSPAYFLNKFDRSKFGFEWGWTYKHLIEPLLLEMKMKEEGRAQFYSYWSQWTYDISLYLEKNIAVPCHRDLHSRNIMLFQEQHYFIDFQDARLGTLYYDLVSFAFDAYLEFDEAWERDVVDCYHQLCQHPWDEHLYGCQALQRLFKAAGSFASFYVNQKDHRYLGYLPQTLKLLHRLICDRQYGGSLAKNLSSLLADLWDYWTLCGSKP